LAAVALLGLSRAHAADTHGILVLEEWGIYSATVERRVPDPNATTGHNSIMRDIRLIERTHQVCAKLGSHFGIRYRVRGDVPANTLAVSIDFVHPPMMNVRGAMQSHDEMTRRLRVDISTSNIWTFSEPRELVPGEWHIIVRHGGDTDIDEKFDVQTMCAAPIA
jgi:hypothetical protein